MTPNKISKLAAIMKPKTPCIRYNPQSNILSKTELEKLPTDTVIPSRRLLVALRELKHVIELVLMLVAELANRKADV